MKKRTKIILAAGVFIVAAAAVITTYLCLQKYSTKEANIVPAPSAEENGFNNYNAGGQIAAIGDTLYYIDASFLSGSTRMVKDKKDSYLAEKADKLYAYQGSLYLLTKGSVAKLNKDFTTTVLLGHVIDFAVTDTAFYYIDDEHTLCRCDHSGKKRTEIVKEALRVFPVLDKMYFMTLNQQEKVTEIFSCDRPQDKLSMLNELALDPCFTILENYLSFQEQAGMLGNNEAVRSFIKINFLNNPVTCSVFNYTEGQTALNSIGYKNILYTSRCPITRDGSIGWKVEKSREKEESGIYKDRQRIYNQYVESQLYVFDETYLYYLNQNKLTQLAQ